MGSNPIGVSVSPDGSKLYVANYGSDNVSVINTATNAVVTTVAVGSGPNSLGNFIANIPVCTGTAQVFTITVNPTPAAPTATAQSFCGIATVASLVPAPSANIKWYNVATGGTALASTTALATGPYYVDSTNTNGCVSSRTSVSVTINALPPAPTATTQSFCGSATVANLVPAPSANIKWYNVATGGTALATTTALAMGPYYVDSTNTNGCVSSRTTVSVTINALPTAPTATTTIYYAQGATATALTATGTSLLWYTAATGGTGSATAPTPSTATVGTTSYWVSQTVSTCESPRTKIDVIIKSTATHLNFDGVNDAVTLSATGFPIGNSARTIEAWIRTTQNTGGGTIMTYGNLAANSRFALYQTGGKLNFVAEGNDYNTNVTINDGVWHHIAATHDGTNLRVYIDGVQAGTTQAKTFATTGTQFSIGYRGVAAEFFNGDIDEVRVWNVARTAPQLGSNCPLVGDEAGLVAYYRFDQGFPAGNNTGVTNLADIVGTNNGTLSGFALTGNTSNWLMTSPLVTGPDVVPTVNYCLNATATALTAPGTGLLWYTTLFGGTGSSTAPTPATNTAGTVSYWVTQPTICGESPRSKISVVTNALPPAPTAAAQSFCGSATVANLLPAPSANMKWYNVATAGTALATTTALATGTYYIDSTNSNGCVSTRTSVGITINAIPAAPTATATIYYAQGATTTALTATGSNLLWYTVATGGSGSATAPTPSTATVGTTSYWVSQTVSSCESPRTKIDVFVKSTATHLNFDGVNDAIALTATGFPMGNSARTIEAWIRTTQNNGGGAIMTYGNLSANNRFALYQTGGSLAFVAEGNDYNTGIAINNGAWHHVAATFDGTNLKAYLDGVQIGTNQAKTFNTTGTPFSIGYRGVANSENFQGDIDEVRVWNVARTAAQLGSNCPLMGNEAGLVAYYRFDQGFPAGNNTGVTTLVDATTNNNNGTLSGFALTGNTSNWLMTSPLVTGPDVASTVNYCLNATSIALTAPGTGLLWYTTQFGGAGNSTAPTPATNASGTTSYWVTQPTSGCGESPRTKIDVIVNTNPLTIAAANKTQILSVSGNTVFSNNCLDLIASVVPNGATPVTGSTTAKVWIESTQPAQFVKRHYEITPATNTATATAKVTLYFTQPEFDAFNAVSAVDLPTGPADATGKANLLIEKRSGVSSDGSGLPSTYTGSIITIDPLDADIVWNVTASRWEISFDVTGFSGFFVKTAASVLPLRIINFTGTKQANANALNWLTADEINTNQFELERSTDGRSYNTIALIKANGNGSNNYSYTDNTATAMCWYRLKIMDTDGRFTYSNIVKLNSLHSNNINVYPNPVQELFTIQGIDRSMLKTTVQLVDATGKLIKNIVITATVQQVNIDNLNKGIYFLRFNNGSVIKVIKE